VYDTCAVAVCGVGTPEMTRDLVSRIPS